VATVAWLLSILADAGHPRGSGPGPHERVWPWAAVAAGALLALAVDRLRRRLAT
jgi:hypothetical protein